MEGIKQLTLSNAIPYSCHLKFHKKEKRCFLSTLYSIQHILRNCKRYLKNILSLFLHLTHSSDFQFLGSPPMTPLSFLAPSYLSFTPFHFVNTMIFMDSSPSHSATYQRQHLIINIKTHSLLSLFSSKIVP